jgi:protocatechuate 3,4-dioxygenase beta subunit
MTQAMGRRKFLGGALLGGAAVATGTLVLMDRARAQALCARTDENIEGPFYRAGAPSRRSLWDQGGLEIAGLVQHCGRPIAGAELDVWQADPRGAYDNAGWTLRGRMRADDRGRYRLITVHPGHYLNGDRYRPAHIHVKVRAPGAPELTTQLYFENDPYNDGDPFFLPSLLLRPRRDGDLRRARFDFAL